MKKSLTILALAVAAPLAAQSASTPGTLDTERVEAGIYSVDPSHTLVGWTVNHFGFNDYFGIFGDSTGTLTIDPANLDSASVDITIPVSKVTTASAGLTDHLLRPGKDGKAPDFFGAEPADARFVSTSVEADGLSAEITGDLTLNGVTKPVVLSAELTGAGTNPFNKKLTVGFEGTATIKRSEFGINYGLGLIGDEVDLNISVAFEK